MMMKMVMIVIMMILTMNSFSLSAMKSKRSSPGPVIRLSLAHTVLTLCTVSNQSIKEKYTESPDV